MEEKDIELVMQQANVTRSKVSCHEMGETAVTLSH